MSIIKMPVQDLMYIFVDGLRVLIPVFERAKLGWREEDAYDPWEKTAEILYDSIVASTIEYSIFVEPVCPVSAYGVAPNSYARYSYFSETGKEKKSAFIEFVSDDEPFDTCLFATLDEQAKIVDKYRKKLSAIEFLLVPRSKGGNLNSGVKELVWNN